ncbi:unnamed protein product [Blepharisma stoltei]|uniref:Cyclic nucleotide-binding domain-containing protein n=1 Tax=Blepharisma stoltei TaxID=1481888 RepID=A0AAU9IWQ9_9CILI|nr:unnamed protein product [Blepharisma stoltei]
MNFDTKEAQLFRSTFHSHRYHHSDHICLSPKFPMILSASQKTRPSLQGYSNQKRAFTSHLNFAMKSLGTKSTESLCGRYSTSSNIFKTYSHAESKDIFPEWLTERKDFQKQITRMSNLALIDLGLTCEKPENLREDLEKRALREWCRLCPFFKPLSEITGTEVCKKLKTYYFPSGSVLMKEGDHGDNLYIIYKGMVEIYKNSVDGCIAVVAPRNHVGEVALETDGIRKATVKAQGDVVALELKKADYNEIILKQKPKEKYETADFLKQVPFFKEWGKSKLARVAWDMFQQQYNEGKIIYEINSKPLHFFIVKEGSVALEVDVTLKHKNRLPVDNEGLYLVNMKKYKKTIRICESTDFFGEEELILGIPRKTRAISMSPNTVLFQLHAEDFNNQFKEKDKQDMQKIYEGRPSTGALRKSLNKELQVRASKYQAILQASQISPMPQGRLFQDIRMNKKVDWAKKLMTQLAGKISKQLIEEENYLEVPSRKSK